MTTAGWVPEIGPSFFIIPTKPSGQHQEPDGGENEQGNKWKSEKHCQISAKNKRQNRAVLMDSARLISNKRTSSKYQKLHFNILQHNRILTFLLLIISLLGDEFFFGPEMVWFVRAQCPWTKESIELHSDCICDFNPSLTSSLDDRPVNRMSVQCSPVNFNQLLFALRQTASVELPNELVKSLSATTQNGTSGGSPEEAEVIASAGIQLASQAKLDLLHISNSTIKLLASNTFIVDSLSLSLPLQVTPLDRNSSELVAELNHYLVVAIQSLHLSRCGIESIESGAFNGLEWSLTSLSLSDNLLENVPSEALVRLVNLKVLDLSNNRIIQLRANAFSSLSRLSTLRLADNKLAETASVAQPELTSNSSHPVQVIDLQAFNGLEGSLTDLNLKNTQLNAFPLAVKPLLKLAFLNLAQNQISSVPAGSFDSMNTLTAINLERNRISRIENNTFSGIEQSLSSLSLLGNLLDSFPVEQLANLTAIRRLDLGFNQIESLPVNAFNRNQQLILIALDGNPLDTLPEEAFKPLQGILRGMSIGGKALNCDCRLSWMLRWQQEFNMQISSRERQPQFCAKPHYLRSLVSFAALKPEHLICPPQSTTVDLNTTQHAQARNISTSSWHSTQSNQQNELAASPLATSPVTGSSLAATTENTPKLTTSRDEDVAGSPTSRMDTEDTSARVEPPEATQASNLVEELNFSLPGTSSSQTYGNRLNISTIIFEGSTNLPSFGGNSLSLGYGSPSLPDEEIFLDDEEGKILTDRQGFLPNNRPIERQQIRGRHQKQTSSSVMGKPGEHGSNSSHLIRATTSVDLLRHTSSQQASRSSESTSRINSPPKQMIQSVFGNRAGDNQKNKTTTSSSITITTNRVQATSERQASSIVPAVATTLNIYKSTLEPLTLPVGSSRAAAPVATTLAKAARFVDDTSTPSTEFAHFKPNKLSVSQKNPSTNQLIESEIEKYTIAPSIISPRFQSVSSSQPAPTKPSTTPEPNLRQKLFEIRRITEGVVATSTQPSSSELQTHTSSYSNNTRMSVSSMYRLGANRTTTTTTSPRPTTYESMPETTTVKMIGISNEPKLLTPATNAATTSQGFDRSLTRHPIQGLVEKDGLDAITTTSNNNLTNPIRKEQFKETVESTTRMAATVRFVDSIGLPVFRVIQANSRPAETSKQPTSTTTSTTSKPALQQQQQQQQLQQKLPPPPMAATTTTLISETLKSKPPLALTTVTNSELVDSTSTSKQPPLRSASIEQPIQVNKVQLIRKEHGGGSEAQRNPINNFVVQDRQQDAKLTLTTPAQQTQRPQQTSDSPEMSASFESTTDLETSRSSRVPTHSNGSTDESNQRRARDEDSRARDISSKSLVGRLFRMADFDQFALIMAAFLCFLILLITLTIVCVCSSSWLRRKGKSSKQPARLCFSSRSIESPASGETSTTGSILRRLLCCCCWSCSGHRRAIAPKRLPLIHDDSSGSSSNGEAPGSGLKKDGKSMLLAGGIESRLAASQNDLALFESIKRVPPGDTKGAAKKQKKQRYNFDNLALEANQDTGIFRTKPIDHEASIQLHRQAHAMDQQYFLALSAGTNNNGGRTLGRRKSMYLPQSETLRRQFSQVNRNEHDWVRDDDPGATFSSCDSDKSCSPGANKNNRYNINQAHRHYLAGKSDRDQIQASMFVTTLKGRKHNNNNHPRSGLLQTIESGADYLDRMSSDKSSTDDSRAPLSGNKQQSGGNSRNLTAQNHPTTLRAVGRAATKVGSFGISQIARSRSIGRMPSSALQQQQHLIVQQQQEGPFAGASENNQDVCHDDFLNSDLIPISAEEHWPEPYVEPLEPTEQSVAAATLGKSNLGNQLRNPQHQHHHHHHHHKGNQQKTNFNEIIQTQTIAHNNSRRQQQQQQQPRAAYDDAYLANWHTVSRLANKPARLDLEGVNSINEEGQFEPDPYGRNTNLLRYRSIPSLTNATGSTIFNNQQQQSLLTAQMGGAANWLRWTPPNMMVEPLCPNQMATSARHQRGLAEETIISPLPSSTNSNAFGQGGRDAASAGSSWHRDNHVDTVYVSSSNGGNQMRQ